jgi:ABC-2 type transport system ATP-binding protein
MNAVVEVKGLTKRYGDVMAANKVSFDIEKGEIFGLLGPNGAGKTTTVELIEGLRKPDSGFIKVCGIDTSDRIDKVKELIGVQLQTTTLYDKIRIGEAINLFGGYYQKSLPTTQILGGVSLSDKRDSFVEALSGGQRQRLALALALVNDPEILFLDEPTTGLDPQARRNVWDIVERLREQGKTIILTTHYMEEAERLCDRIGIMDQGKIVALDTPRDLIAKQNLESAIELITSNGVSKDFFHKLPNVSNVTQDGDRFILHTKETSPVLTQLTHLSESGDLDLKSISVRKATLEDVFLELTGKKLRE